MSESKKLKILAGAIWFQNELSKIIGLFQSFGTAGKFAPLKKASDTIVYSFGIFLNFKNQIHWD